MPEWCPNCNAMLPEGLAQCPRCNTPLREDRAKDEVGFTRADLFWHSAYIIGIVMIPIIIGVVIGLICILLFIATPGG